MQVARTIDEAETKAALKSSVCSGSWDVIVFAPALRGNPVVANIPAEQEHTCVLLLLLLQLLEADPKSCRRGLVVLTQGVQVFETVKRCVDPGLLPPRTALLPSAR